MQGSIWRMLSFILISGAIGGAVNALMTDNGFLKPKSEKTSEGSTVMRPGYLGNVLLGAVAAAISWGLYGPLSAYVVVGTAEATAAVSPDRVGLSLASLVGALLVGIGGARWLSNEVDKNLLRAAASEAASNESSDETSRQIALANPARALSLARGMRTHDR